VFIAFEKLHMVLGFFFVEKSRLSLLMLKPNSNCTREVWVLKGL
jgi:hypothetical protein